MDKWTEGEMVSPEKKPKRPRSWWVVYHLWAGICLKIYTDASGLSKIIIGDLKGGNSSSASYYGIIAAIVAIGAVALGYFLSKKLINVIEDSDISRQVKLIIKSVLPVLYLIASVFLAFITLSLLPAQAKFPDSEQQSLQQNEVAPVIAFTTSQSSEGLTEKDLDQHTLERLEDWIVNISLEKSKKIYLDMGYTPEEFKSSVLSSSVYVTVQDKKLAIVKIEMENIARSVTVIGINGNELFRVTCVQEGDQDIPVWSGNCGKEIHKSFGVRL